MWMWLFLNLSFLYSLEDKYITEQLGLTYFASTWGELEPNINFFATMCPILPVLQRKHDTERPKGLSVIELLIGVEGTAPARSK